MKSSFTPSQEMNKPNMKRLRNRQKCMNHGFTLQIVSAVVGTQQRKLVCKKYAGCSHRSSHHTPQTQSYPGPWKQKRLEPQLWASSKSQEKWTFTPFFYPLHSPAQALSLDRWNSFPTPNATQKESYICRQILLKEKLCTQLLRSQASQQRLFCSSQEFEEM